MKMFRFFLLFIVLVFLSCSNKSKSKNPDLASKTADATDAPNTSALSKEEKIIGAWSFSEYISENKAKKLLGDVSEALSVNVTMEGETNFYPGGTMKMEGVMILHISNTTTNEEKSISFNVRQTATFSFNNDNLIETTTDGTITPANEYAKALIESDPSYAEEMRPLKGETSIIKVLSLNETIMETEEAESGLKITYHKKNK